MNKVIIFVFFLLYASACSKQIAVHSGNYNFKSPNGLPQYSSLDYWAAHPWKWDPSDSIPTALKKQGKQDTIADAFFIHPTTLVDKDYESWNATIDDSVVNIKTDFSPILYQASVFNQKCRVFAPRYRQAHIKSFYTRDTAAAAAAIDTAYQDIKNAFIHYLSNWNKNRPIIIAAHSQGTVHAAKLLKEFFEGKDLQNQLVCAYIIGMPIPTNYYNRLPACKDSLATGCVVSWRTFKTGYTDTSFVSKEKFTAIVTNPLSWRMDTTFIAADKNTGGVLQKFNKLKPGVVNAQIHGNVLWTSKPKFFGNIFLKTKNYHIGDINLFYNNIMQNVNTRLNMFLIR
ncbi:MAG: hypothetical protein RL172_2401 [Bacteroidota bacterium]|jgi:hypothetical protein